MLALTNSCKMADGMSKDINNVKQFAMSLVNMGDSAGPHNQVHMLVLKTDGTFFYLDLIDKERFHKASNIKADNGIHLAWKLFDSHANMEAYSNDQQKSHIDYMKSPKASKMDDSR